VRPRSRGDRYVPLDELLDQPRVRYVRALLRMGWAESVDVLEALGDVMHDSHLINNYSVLVGRLVREGWLKRRELAGGGRAGGRFEYAVTLRGRVDLQFMLERAKPESELGPLDDSSAADGEPKWKRDLRRAIQKSNRERARYHAQRAARSAA
jgi:hypothetical protein